MGSGGFPASFLQDHVGSGGRNVRPGESSKSSIFLCGRPRLFTQLVDSMHVSICFDGGKCVLLLLCESSYRKTIDLQYVIFSLKSLPPALEISFYF